MRDIPAQSEIDLLPAERSFHFRFAAALARCLPRGKEASVRWFCRALVGSPVKLRTPHGAWIVTDPVNLDLYTRLRRLGAWDEAVVQSCVDLIEPGQCFFDIGANAGYITIEVAATAQGDIDVCAFEPQPSLALALARSARLNGFGHVSVFNAMLGANEGMQRLYLAPCALHASATPRARGPAIECPTYNLAKLVADGTCRAPDVIKIDVEGAEKEIIASAREMLAAVQPAIVFECDENATRFGYTRQDLLDCLRTCGYEQFFFVDTNGRNYVSVENGPAAQNIAAVPPSRMSERFLRRIA